MALLDPVDGLPINPRQVGQFLLRKTHVKAGSTDAFTDSPAAGDDPVGGRGGWHPTTLSGS